MGHRLSHQQDELERRPRFHTWKRGRRAAPLVDQVLIGVGFAVLFFLLPHALVGDDFTRFADIETLIHHGQLSNSQFSLVMPLASAPFLLLGELIRSPDWWAARFNVIVVAAGVLAAFRLLRGRMDAGLLAKLVLLLLFMSFLTNRLRDYNAEVFTATAVALGIVLLVTGRRGFIGWTAIVIGVVNAPATLVGLLLITGSEAVRRRRLRCLTPVVVAAALIMFEAWARRGGPLVTGYEGNHGFKTILPYSGKAGFSYPFLLGVLSILFSFGRGLLFFTPGIALWPSSRTRRLAQPYRPATVLMLLFLCGQVLVYAKWWAWYGGLSWGPRFFVFAAIPSSLLIALRLHAAANSRRADPLVLLLLSLSAWVGISGAIGDPTTLGFCANDQYALESMCWYTPEFSSLWHPLVQFPTLTTSVTIVVIYSTIVFAYLAAPAVAGLGRALIARRPSAEWAKSWRF